MKENLLKLIRLHEQNNTQGLIMDIQTITKFYNSEFNENASVSSIQDLLEECLSDNIIEIVTFQNNECFYNTK